MCYVVPLMAGAVSTVVWKKNKTVQMWWLALMFYGSSLFGVIDHLWNGELFFVSKVWLKDLALGFVITAAILLAWKVILVVSEKNISLNAYMKSAHPEKI